jgi:hypothetical protein
MPDPVEEFLGDWQLRGGRADKSCASGAWQEMIDNPHQVRVVEQPDSAFLLQYFEGAEMDSPPACEFLFRMRNSVAVLAEERTCPGPVTWHTSTAMVDMFGYLTLETNLTDEEGCNVDARPVYQRLPQ